jgi:predicted MFS family arabinose efflux permease
VQGFSQDVVARSITSRERMHRESDSSRHAPVIARTELKTTHRRRSAFTFIIVIGILSFFADFTYEGARSITGPFLGVLGAGAVVISAVGGLGELLGYVVRLPSGFLSGRTRKFWPIAIVGYAVQMAAVPSLALATTWQAAATLIILERIGRAIRNPPRDVMISHAAQEIGYGRGFGIHEALDQAGALFGPLAVAAVLATHRAFQQAFAVLLIPALVCLTLVVTARILYPKPENLTSEPLSVRGSGLPRVFWVYLVGAGLVAAGFADYSLLAYHYHSSLHVSNAFLPIFYAIAMAMSGSGSLVFGQLFDRFGLIVLVPLTMLGALFAPLVFLGDFRLAVLGSALWGLGMGVQESIIPAAVASMVSREHRPSAYGLFTAVYGVAWLLGSVLIGILYTRSLGLLVAFCLVTQLLAVPIFIYVGKQMRTLAST